MGLMRFLITERDRVEPLATERVYLAGADGVPLPCQKRWESEHILQIQQEGNESGRLHLLWPVAGHGRVLLATCRLMERPLPYHLTVELARGALSRLRSQTAAWELAGLEPSASLREEIRQAEATFIAAATDQPDPDQAARLAEETIHTSFSAAGELVHQYSQQTLAVRHQPTSPLNTLLAVNPGVTRIPPHAEPMLAAAINAAGLPLAWKTIQPAAEKFDWTLPDRQFRFCLQHDLKVIAGPLLRPDLEELPDPVIGCCSNFERLEARVKKHLEAVVCRYRGRVHLWHTATLGPMPGPLPLSDEQRLRLNVLMIDWTRRLDPRTPLMVSVSQPWGEYLIDRPAELPPWQLVEMLIRAELGVAAIGLELNLGYWPAGSLPRGPLEINRLVDQWALLGLPLVPILTIPSSGGPDPHSSPRVGGPLVSAADSLPSLDWQKQGAQQLLPLLLAKQSVQAVIWNQTFDSVPHRFAHGGLFDAQDRPKPALASLITFRREHLH